MGTAQVGDDRSHLVLPRLLRDIYRLAQALVALVNDCRLGV
jgi:hypothetical protein